MASDATETEWTTTALPGVYRAYTPDGASLWLEDSGRGFIISHGQTVWESETAGTRERVEDEARRLGLLPACIQGGSDDE